MRFGFVMATARREMRATLSQLFWHALSLTLGVAALVALQSFRASVDDAVALEARELLGADVQLRSRAPFSEASLQAFSELDAIAESPAASGVSFASMALGQPSKRTRLVQIRAVEAGFPYYGAIETEPPELWADFGDSRSVIVDPAVLIQLELEVGDRIALGGVDFRVIGSVGKAPGTVGPTGEFLPRVYLPPQFVAETGLLRKGSLAFHVRYLKAPNLEAVERWQTQHAELLERERVRIRTSASYQEELSDGFRHFIGYLGLIGLAALLLGGIGIATGVRAFVTERLDHAALLRSLGATQFEVLMIYLLQASVLGLFGASLGVAMGLSAQYLVPSLLAAYMPLEISTGARPSIVVAGLLLGVGAAALFSIWPLLELREVSPLRALRRDFQSETRSDLRQQIGMVISVAVGILLGSLWQAPQWRHGIVFAAGLGAALLLLFAVSNLLIGQIRKRLPPSAPYWMRQGVAALFRPRNQALASILAIGFGVTVITTLQVVEFNLLRRLQVDHRPDRPNLVLFDVQTDQSEAVADFLRERNAPILEQASIIPGRIAAINGEQAVRGSRGGSRRRPSENANREREREREGDGMLGYEYRLTSSDQLRETETIVSGAWWSSETDTSSPHPVSVEVGLARDLDLQIGDLIRWDIQGVPIESRITNLREVDWGRFATNFFVVFAPGALEEAPQSSVFLTRLDDETERAQLQSDLVEAFPNISALDATVLLRAVDSIIGKLSLAVRALALISLGTGFVILIGAISSSRSARMRELLLLRTLGADQSLLRRVVWSEYAVLGALAATVGVGIATLLSAALVRFLFEQTVVYPWASLAAILFGTVFLSVGLGWLVSRPPADVPPLAALRSAAGT